MSFGVVVYVTIGVLYVMRVLYMGKPPSSETIGAIAVIGGLGVVSYLGYLPRFAQQIFARMIRFPQDLRFGLSTRPFNYNRISDDIVVGRIPRSKEDFEMLIQKEQIEAIVDLTESWEQMVDPATISRLGLERINFPTPDFASPSDDDLRTAVEFIKRQTDMRRTVYIHCNGGKGRAATTAAAWLIYRDNISVEEAYKRLKAKRKIANLQRWNGALPVWKALVRFHENIQNQSL
eukprot:m.9722 g.9722  ORF g.9722 m.9722 type:complete len:234 (+) comp3530_c0_seq1:86-787(+)